MENQLKTFFNEEFGEIRTTLVDNEPWFVARDVCKCLDIAYASKAVERLDEDEKGMKSFRTPGGTQSMLVVNEYGLYNLIFRSNKEESKNFRRWVMHEVIPAIRKTGMYMVTQPKSNAEMLLMFAQNAVEMERRINFLEESNTNQKKELFEVKTEAKDNKEAIDSFRAIFSYKDEDWRNMSRYVVSEIAKKTVEQPATKAALKLRTEAVWKEAYYRLTSATNVKLNLRQRNRIQERGKKVSKLQVIAEDNRLRKIFTNIIKEMAVQYDIRVNFSDVSEEMSA